MYNKKTKVSKHYSLTYRRNLHRVTFALDLRPVSAAVAAAHHEHDAQDEHEDLARMLVDARVELRRATRRRSLKRSGGGRRGRRRLPAPLGLLRLD